MTEGNGAATLTDSGALSFADLDINDVVTVSQTYNNDIAWNGGTLNAGVASALVAGFSVDQNSWDYSASQNLDFLRAGETITMSFDVVATDDSGAGNAASAATTVTITITGSNDAPNIQLVTTDSAASTLTETNAGLSATGTLTVTDVDLNDTVASTVTTIVASGTAGGLGLSNAQLLGLLTVAPTSGLAANTGDTHNLTWTFNSATQPQAFDYLAPGQSLTLTYTVQSTDNNAASDTQTVTITINGTNDGPAAVTDNVITNIALGTNFVVPEWALLANDVDPDGGGALDISSVGGAAGLSATLTAGIGSNGFVTVNDPTPAGGSFTYQATDGTTTGASGNVNVSRDGVGSIDGTAGSDVIVSGTGGATIVGNAGNDVLLGGSGNDTYQFGLADGTDLIRDSGSGGDLIQIITAGPGDATAISTLNFERVGTDLVISVGSTQITVDDHYVGGNAVEGIQFTPGGTVFGYALSGNVYDISTDAATPLNEGGGRDVIASSSGIETLNGGTGNDLLFGNGGADTINGEAGGDLLVGGAGTDSLNGGDDSDVMVGGADSDTFIFNSGLSAATNVDTIRDFDANAADKIHLDESIFAAFSTPPIAGTPLAAANFAANVGGAAGDSNDFILYDTATGNLYYDADGNGAGARILFATLTLTGVSGTVDNTDFIVIP